MLTREQRNKLALAIAGLPFFPSDIIKVARVVGDALDVPALELAVSKLPFEYDTQAPETSQEG